MLENQSEFAINAVNNLPDYKNNYRFYIDLTKNLIKLKGSIAKTNKKLNIIDHKKADTIIEVSNNLYNNFDNFKDLFPLNVLQYAAGTSLNMNINEVISNIAKNEFSVDLDPFDDVNLSQSTNDIFPTAAKITSKNLILELVQNLDILTKILKEKAIEFKNIKKVARTHMQDATLITLGAEFGAYAWQIELGKNNLMANQYIINSLPIGGTATGTKVNSCKGYQDQVIKEIRIDFQDNELCKAKNLYTAIANQSWALYFSGIVKSIGLNFAKISTDIKMMASGPEAGLQEIFIPNIQKGSSIMPGKFNPIIPETVQQAVAKIIGNDSAITYAMNGANFELNPLSPIIFYSLFDSITLLSQISLNFGEKCIKGITPNYENLIKYSSSTQIYKTKLSNIIGYEEANNVFSKFDLDEIIKKYKLDTL